MIKKSGSSYFSGYIKTGNDGLFSFDNIEQGTYSLYVYYAGIQMLTQNGANNLTISGTNDTISLSIRIDSNFIRVAVFENVRSFYTVQDVEITNGQSSCYNALHTVTVAGNAGHVTIHSGGSVKFIAGQKVALLPVTIANQGAYLHAFISNDTGIARR